MDTTFTIGDLARQSGVSASRIRFYERTGVIPTPPRSESGYRRYSTMDVRRLQLVRRARLLGMSTAELTTLAHDTFDLECQTYADKLHSLFDRQRTAIDQHIRDLEALRDEIDALASELDRHPIPAGLRVVECSRCFLMDDSSDGIGSTSSCCECEPDAGTKRSAVQPIQPLAAVVPSNDPLARAEILDVLACAIAQRPAGAPGINDLAPFITTVRREADSLVITYTVNGTATVENFVSAERLCCDSIDWNTGSAGSLRITGTPEQVTVLAEVFGQLHSERG